MMDSNLEWTEHLGNVFMAQQAETLNAVQRLRQQAERTGALHNGWQESVVNEGDNVELEPPSSQEVYLPTYNADCVYAADPACSAGDGELAWDSGILLPFGYWQWGAVDWPHRNIHVQHGDWTNRGWHAHATQAAEHGQTWRHTGMHIARQPVHAVAPEYHYAPAANEPLGRAIVARPVGPPLRPVLAPHAPVAMHPVLGVPLRR